jgi:hypothetical protein
MRSKEREVSAAIYGENSAVQVDELNARQKISQLQMEVN